ncbi:MAG: 16S rRNA (guanine(527)-N(7))-methyltransferase RsmG [bacterium JZ-2024 1]
MTHEQELRLRHYASMLHQQGKTMNLVGWKSLDELWNDGILFTVAALRDLPIPPSGKCVDVGSGAGIVGIPLAILFPRTEVVLLESNSRKVSWLNQVVTELQLTQTRTLNQRAEVAGRNEAHRAQYDWSFSRALGPLGVAYELTLPFVRIGGFAVQIKTPEARSEFLSSMPPLHALGGIPRWIVQFEGPRADRNGALFVSQKKSPTPPRFPRKPGIPRKRPLSKGSSVSRRGYGGLEASRTLTNHESLGPFPGK